MSHKNVRKENKLVKGIYLAAYKAHHPNYDMDYCDIDQTSEHINVIDDMMNVDLSNYDYIIATPPCNYWSRANYRRETSEYAQKTKHLLPDILDKLRKLGKPYIVENVRNEKLFKKHGILDKADFVYYHGRHTYWTNIMINFNNIEQRFDFSYGGKRLVKNSQGGENVHKIIEWWLKKIHEK